MRLTSDHPDFENTLVFLNGKWCMGAIEADDEEGWVEIHDPKALVSPLSEEELKGKDQSRKADHTGIETGEWEEVPRKRMTGTVQFKKLQT